MSILPTIIKELEVIAGLTPGQNSSTEEDLITIATGPFSEQNSAEITHLEEALAAAAKAPSKRPGEVSDPLAPFRKPTTQVTTLSQEIT
ncbi:MAG: hypothetical protein K940chlam2_00943 [Chlamydiae bacterium]|nr:hypothetical protein [Chlamydiota bacterium]